MDIVRDRYRRSAFEAKKILLFDFYGIARRSVPKIVGREMDRAITKALQSAK